MDRPSTKIALIRILLIGWIALVYCAHYWIYYGPRVTRFIQQWLGR